MGAFKKYDGSVWQSINPKKLKGLPYTGTLPAVLTDTKAGYLHSYKIYGNTEQTGTPTPENPIVPSECGERTRNLFDLNRLSSDTWTTDTRYYLNGGIANSKAVNPAAVTISVNNDTLSVTTNAGNGAGFLVEVAPSTEYRLAFAKSKSIPSNKASCTYAFVDTTETIGQLQAIYGDDDAVVFTTDSNTKYVYFVFRITSGTISYSSIMLSEGQTVRPYEPYGYKLPLLSGSTPVDIYLGDDTLSTEEYVDSSTGKIYRMVSGVLTPTDPPVPFPQIPTSANSTTISWAGEGLAPSQFDSIQEWVDIPTYKRVNGEWVEDN